MSERKFKTGPIVSQHLLVGRTRARPCLCSKDVWRNGHCVSAWMACISCRQSPNRRHAEPPPAVLPQGSFTQTYVALRRSLSKISFVPRVKSSRAHRPTAADSLKGSTGPCAWGKAPTQSNWKCPLTSDCRDHRGRHDLLRARRRDPHALPLLHLARRHNHLDPRRRYALPEDALR